MLVEERSALEQRRSEAREEAVFVASTSATLVYHFTQDLEGALQAVALTLGRSDGSMDQASLGPVLAAMLTEFPNLRSVFITDLEGRVIAGPRETNVGLDLSTRPYIQGLREGGERLWSGQMGGLLSGESILAHALVIRDRAGTRGPTWLGPSTRRR